MFGYVKPYVPELKVAEYEKYRAVYCGLCRSMGQITGQASRLTLSYDFVFLAAVRMALEGTEPDFIPFRCAAHPSAKRLLLRDNPALRYTAAAAGILAGAKNADDLADEHGLTRLKPVLQFPLLRTMARRGGKQLPEGTEACLSDRLGQLRTLEREVCPSADQTADVFGEALSHLFSEGLNEPEAGSASRIGRAVGRFLYLCDAADDLEDDVKRRRYNPLAAGWGDLAVDADGHMTELVRESIRTAAPVALEPLGEAVDALDPAYPLTPILKNIVYLGLPASLNAVLTRKKEPFRIH